MKTEKLELSKVLSDDASVLLVVAFTRQESGLITTSDEAAEFLGWTRERAHAAGQELVDFGVVKALPPVADKDLS